MQDTRLTRRNFAMATAATGGGLLAACTTGGVTGMQGNGSTSAMSSGMLASQLTDPGSRRGEYASANGARIFYEVSGEGPPMLLIHGYPLSGALFSRLRDNLNRRFRVVTMDLRGYGKSTAPGTPADIATYATDALALMQQLEIPRAAIGGMSMGGPITFEMYSRAPERFSAMMLFDTIAASASPAEAGLWRGLAEMIRGGGMAAAVPVLIKEMLTGEARRDQKALVTYLESVVKNASVDAGIGGAMALASRPDYTSLLGRIAVPTQIVVGLQDTVYPIEIAMMLNSAIRGSSLAVIDDASHAAVFERPDQVAASMVRFAGGLQL